MAALVTGGSSGIALATVCALRHQGARVVSLDLKPGPADEDGVLALAADVSQTVSVHAAVEEAMQRPGRRDVLVNNAGIGAQGTGEDNPEDEWRRVLEVNVLGVVRVSRACLPHLRRSPAAAIVNTCSVAATTGLPNRALYGATKGAVQALTLAMAASLRLRAPDAVPAG